MKYHNTLEAKMKSEFPTKLSRLATMILLLISAITPSNVHGITNQPAILSVQEENSLKKINNLIVLGERYINLPGANHTDISLARTYALNALALSRSLKRKGEEARCFVLLSKIYREGKENQKGQAYAQLAVSYFDTQHSTKSAGAAYLEMANYLDIKADSTLDKKIYFQEKGVRVYQHYAPKTLELADAQNFLGDLYNYLGSNDKAATYLNAALANYKSLGKKDLQSTYCLLGSAMTALGDFKEGIRYHLLAAESVERNRDTTATALMVYNRLARAYHVLKKEDQAMVYFQKALELAKKKEDISAIILLTQNLCGQYMLLNQPEKALVQINIVLKKYPEQAKNDIGFLPWILAVHSRLGMFRQAEPYLSQLIGKLARNEVDQTQIQVSYLQIMKFYVGTGRFREAALYGNKFFTDLSEKTSAERKITFFRLRYQIDSANRDFRSAFSNQSQQLALEKAVLKRNSDEQITRLNIEFENTKRELDIASNKHHVGLLKQKNSMQKTALKDQRNIRNLSVAGVGLFALMLVGTYTRYRVKKTANFQLSLQKQEIDDQNHNLRDLLNEREWLLKEIHHRVKNNLQIIISLLSSQSIYLEDPSLVEMLRESQNRMNAISLVHQKLYQDGNLSGVHLPTYIHELIHQLRSSFSLKGEIGFSTSIMDVTLDVSQAVPVGLILNESITNAIKHAFADIENPQIAISLSREGDGMLLLEVLDNGTGFSSQIPYQSLESFGINLMSGLAEQLGTKIHINSTSGVQISLIWKAALPLMTRMKKI